MTNFFISAQFFTSQASGISLHTVKRICAEARNNADPDLPDSGPMFVSPGKGYKRAKICIELYDFDSDIVRSVYEFYDHGEYPTALSILNIVKTKSYYI